MLSWLSTAFLLICALILSGRSYQIGERLQLSAAMVISLSAAFIAAATAGSLFINAANQDLLTLQRMLDNLAFYAAIPLLSSALFAIAWNYDWSRAGWGRWLLALFALFELCRRSDVGNEYSQVLACGSSLVFVISALRLPNPAAKLSALLAGTILSTSLILLSPASLWPEWQNTPFYMISFGISLLIFSFTLNPGLYQPGRTEG